ncbi:MAG: Fic family protein [Microbacterium sp.]
MTEDLLHVARTGAADVLTIGEILRWHGALLTGIRDDAAGRFRQGDEWVRVGSHLGANPPFVREMVERALERFQSEAPANIIERIAWFHCEFEMIHPFVDGNGRIGRVLMNHQLLRAGMPPVIVRARSRRTEYYPALDVYSRTDRHDEMTRLLALLVARSTPQTHRTPHEPRRHLARAVGPVCRHARQRRGESREAPDAPGLPDARSLDDRLRPSRMTTSEASRSRSAGAEEPRESAGRVADRREIREEDDPERRGQQHQRDPADSEHAAREARAAHGAPATHEHPDDACAEPHDHDSEAGDESGVVAAETRPTRR